MTVRYFNVCLFFFIIVVDAYASTTLSYEEFKFEPKTYDFKASKPRSASLKRVSLSLCLCICKKGFRRREEEKLPGYDLGGKGGLCSSDSEFRGSGFQSLLPRRSKHPTIRHLGVRY